MYHKINTELLQAEECMLEKQRLELDTFESFADYFFDGLIVDWVVQGKIDRSLENALRVYNQVQQTLGTLKNRGASLYREVDKLEEERQRFVREV